MKRPGFFEGVLVALAASLAGGATVAALTLLFAPSAVLRLLIAGLGLAYLLYLLSRSEDRVGRITSVALWSVATLSAWWLEPPLLLYLCVHLGAIWLVRSLYFHSSVVSALADLGLVALGFASAVWGVSHSGSIALGIWCFFLVQALFVAIPSRVSESRASTGGFVAEDAFERAHRAAEAAVRRLSNTA